MNLTPRALLLNWQFLHAGLPLTVIQVEDGARYLCALDRDSDEDESEHTGQLLDLQPWSRARGGPTRDLSAGGK